MARPSSGRKATSRTPAHDSRQELIDAALDIIVTSGIDAVRIEDVCERVGVTKGSLYWHFQDRQGLIREALFEQLRRLSAAQIEALDQAIVSGASREEYLIRVAGTLVDPFDPEQSEARWQRWELLATARRDPELRELMADLQRSHHRYLMGIMSKAQERGILRQDADPAAVAAAINAIGLGSNNLSYLDADGPTPEAWNALLLLMINLLFPAA